MTKEELKVKIQEAVKKGDISYLRGILAVEKRFTKLDKKRIKWLEDKIHQLTLEQNK